MKPFLNRWSTLSLSVAAAALASACSPVTPSMDKISSLRPLPAKDSIFVVTVSKLDGDEAKVAEESPEYFKFTLSSEDEETKAQLAEYRDTGKTSFQFEGGLPKKFHYALSFEHTSDKKELKEQEEFQLGYDPKLSDDKKTWSLSLEDKSQDKDLGERVRGRLKKVTFFFLDEVKRVTPAPVEEDPTAAIVRGARDSIRFDTL